MLHVATLKLVVVKLKENIKQTHCYNSHEENSPIEILKEGKCFSPDTAMKLRINIRSVLLILSLKKKKKRKTTVLILFTIFVPSCPKCLGLCCSSHATDIDGNRHRCSVLSNLPDFIFDL